MYALLCAKILASYVASYSFVMLIHAVFCTEEQ